MSKFVYKHYGIPISYLGVDYDDLDMPKAKETSLRGKIKNAPQKGTLFIRGTAAPVINQLFTQGRTIKGINFMARSETAFERHMNPQADVILIYNVGSEISMNRQVSRQVLQAILKYYTSGVTLVIVETSFTKSELLHNYDISASNFLTLQEKKEEVWI